MSIFSACLADLCIVVSAFIGRNLLTRVHVETKTGIREEKLCSLTSGLMSQQLYIDAVQADRSPAFGAI